METLKRILLVSLTVAVAGCNRQSNPPGDKTPTAAGRPLAAAATPGANVTFSDYPIPPKPEVTPEFMASGRAVYEQNCAACHGPKGDGQSAAAAFLLPKPRNFVQAKYRLRSTSPCSLPTDTDLYRAVSLGMPGTPMPPWRFHLSETD